VIGDLLEFARIWRNLSLSADALRRLQERKLRAVVRHAYDNVPYYHELFTSAGIHPDDVRSLPDLERIPITTKRDLTTAGIGQTTRRGFKPGADNWVQSSGSTGEPFRTYRDRREARRRQLIEFRGLARLGIKPWDRLAVLGAISPHRARLHQRLGLFRSENIRTPMPVDEQIDRLRRFRPTILWAYPNALRAVMQRLDHPLHRIVQPRFVITSAEVLDPLLRASIVSDLGVEIFNLYAALEIGRIAWECPAHRGLHVNADALMLECLAGESSGAPAAVGTVVVTSLDNYTMPMIRYRLGDLTSFLDGACPCGVTLPRISPPQGRESDMVVLPSGRTLTPLSFNAPIRLLWPKVERWRLTQHALDHLSYSLVLVTRAKFDPPDLDELRRSCLAILGEPVRLDINIVEAIPDSGLKFSPFVSELHGSVRQPVPP
jgi:phenylacetate-CoA ligase